MLKRQIEVKTKTTFAENFILTLPLFALRIGISSCSMSMIPYTMNFHLILNRGVCLPTLLNLVNL